MYGKVGGVLNVLLRGKGGPTVHGTVALGRCVTMYGSMDCFFTMHGIVALGRSTTLHSAVDRGVLLMLAVHGTVKRTTVIHRTLRGFTGNLASRQVLGGGCLADETLPPGVDKAPRCLLCKLGRLLAADLAGDGRTAALFNSWDCLLVKPASLLSDSKGIFH